MSPVISASTAVKRPSASAPRRKRVSYGWRFTEARIDSSRLSAHRTGRPSFATARARYGWTHRSSFPPKPPPVTAWITRTRSGGTPRTLAVASRSMYGVCVETTSVIVPSASR